MEMNRRTFLGIIGGAALALASYGVYDIVRLNTNSQPSSVSKLEERVTGKSKKIEFFINTHGTLTKGSDQINSNALSEIDFYIWKSESGVHQFYSEGLPNGKKPSDSFEVTLPGSLEKSMTIPDNGFELIPQVKTLRSMNNQDTRYNYAVDNLKDIMQYMPNGAFIGREIIGYKSNQFNGVEDSDLLNKTLIADFSLGLEEKIDNSFLENIKKLYVIFDNNGFSSFSKKQKADLTQYIDNGLKVFDSYLHLHKKRGKAFVDNAVSDILKSDVNHGVVFIGANHYNEILNELKQNDQVDFAIYAPKELKLKNETIEEKYKPIIKEIIALKSYLK